MRVRKGTGFIAADVAAYFTGAPALRSNVGEADDWLHPVDADFFLDDPDRFLGPFSPDGLPLQRFGGGSPVAVPSRIAAFGFAHWARWRRQGGDEHREAFFKAARWFAAFPEGRIEHRFDIAGIAQPWVSGLAQGQALSLYARAELIEPGLWRAHFLPALDWIERPISAGGTLDRLPGGALFIEEYPGSQHRHVLNGCLYALVGIVDQLRLGEDARARGLLEAVLESVEGHLPGWERDGWSLYELYPGPLDLPPNFNTPAYQVVHIALLDYLARHVQRPALGAAAERLRRALRSPAKRLGALAHKFRYRWIRGW